MTTDAEDLFENACQALGTRFEHCDSQTVLRPLVLGLLASANIAIAALPPHLELACALAQALGALVDAQCGPVFALTPPVAAADGGRITGGQRVEHRVDDRLVYSYQIPSVIPLDSRLLVLEDLTRLDPNALAVLSHGCLGSEFGGSERELWRHGSLVPMPNLLTVVAVVDVDHRSGKPDRPYTDTFAYHIDIGVALHEESVRQRTPAVLPAPPAERSCTLAADDVARFRHAQGAVAFCKPAEDDIDAIIEATNNMGWGLQGMFQRLRGIAQARAAAHGRDMLVRADYRCALELRCRAYAAMYNRFPGLD